MKGRQAKRAWADGRSPGLWILVGLGVLMFALPGLAGAQTGTMEQIHGLWSGETRGNAQGTAVFTFVQRCSRLQGEYRMQGPAGEWRRSLEGRWDATLGAFVFHDTGFLTELPAEGYRFCRIERYELRTGENANVLIGFYTSEDCNDRAELKLYRVLE